VTVSITEFARILWQTARDVPQFVLTRATELIERQRQRDALDATVGEDDAVLWLYATGGDAQAALNLIHAGYDLETEELMATEPGWYDREEQRHLQFAHLRTHGEWFRLEGELREHIDELKSQAARVDKPSTS